MHSWSCQIVSDCGFMACKVIFILGTIDCITDQYMESVNVQLYKVCVTILVCLAHNP